MGPPMQQDNGRPDPARSTACPRASALPAGPQPRWSEKLSPDAQARPRRPAQHRRTSRYGSRYVPRERDGTRALLPCIRFRRNPMGWARPCRFAHALRELGIEAERAMFSATHGINTHKGANFAFALILGSCGAFLSTGSLPSGPSRYRTRAGARAIHGRLPARYRHPHPARAVAAGRPSKRSFIPHRERGARRPRTRRRPFSW